MLGSRWLCQSARSSGGSSRYSLALMTSYLGPDHPDIALMLSGLATCYHFTGETQKSHEAFERSQVTLTCRNHQFFVTGLDLVAP